MRQHTFRVGEGEGYRFDVDSLGGLTAIAREDGSVPVIGGQDDLSKAVEVPTAWSAIQEATGNNSRISDGRELYAGAGFGDPLIEGQVEDVMWALAEVGGRSSGRLLELGCGPGFLLEALQRRLPGWSLVGVDPSPDSVAQAHERGVECLQGFVDTVDLEPGFDAIVVMGNFQLHADPRATLRHLARVAAPRAALYLDSKNPLSSTRRVARRLMTTPAKSVPPVNAFAAHAFHGLRVALTQGQLRSELERSGWEVCEIRTTAPRLLRFGNTHELGRGLKGRVWRGFDRIDRLTDERAWIQVSARRR